MAQMKIVSIRVTDENGIEHEWEGIEGSATFYTTYIKDDSDKKTYLQCVDAHLKIGNVDPPKG
jgi:hypothetical protein